MHLLCNTMRHLKQTNIPQAPEPWDLWLDGAHAPGMNMAIDDALLRSAGDRGRPLLRFYEWDRPSVSIGYVQKFVAAPSEEYSVVRRPTGGGVVYHDHDVTYTVVIPPGHWMTGLDRTRSYDCINRSVMAGLQRCDIGASLADTEIPTAVDRGTMVCFKNPTRYDIMANERKIAGSAQRRTRTGILHQGSIHFGHELAVPRGDITAGLKKGFEEILRADFCVFSPSAELIELAETLTLEQYSTDQWNRRR